MERTTLLKNLITQDGVTKMESQIQAYGGRVIDGYYGDDLNRAREILGDFDVRTIGVSRRIEKLTPSETTAIGGWYAIRTADMQMLRKGYLTDPETGLVMKVDSVDKVADWIKIAISIDQIIESIGLFEGERYVAISEMKLWGDRIKSEVEKQLRRKLSKEETELLLRSLEEAEQKRYEYTGRYLTFVRYKIIEWDRANNKDNSYLVENEGGTIILTRIIDNDIWPDLVRVRDEMFDIAGITKTYLCNRFPDQIGAIESYSVVWGMYTGPYLKLLQRKGFVQTEKGLVIEPSFHALSETNAKALVVSQYLQAGNYLQKGPNKNLGFVAYAENMKPNGQRISRTDTIDKVPNVVNWQAFIQSLQTDANISNLTLADNPVFVWGVNLFPFGETRTALEEMVRIKDRYQTERKEIRFIDGIPELKKELVRRLNNKYQILMEEQAHFVISELEKMLCFVFE